MQKGIILKLFFIFFIIILFYHYGFSFSVIPGRIYKKVKLNEKTLGEYQIVNNESIPLKFTIQKKGSAEWFILNNTEFILKPGESKKVKYEILVKNPILRGEQNSSISVSQVPSQVKEGAPGASFEARMSLPVYVFVDGTEIMDYEVSGFSCNGSFTKKDNSISGSIGTGMTVKNTGNIHFICEPILFIYRVDANNKNELIGQKTLPFVVMLFPGEERKIDIKYEGTLNPGDYKTRSMLYFKFDEDLERNDELSKKEKVFNQYKRFRIDKEGNTLIEK